MGVKTIATAESLPVIQIKLHRIPVLKYNVNRTHLLERLDRRSQRTITLTPDLAGYGKSILVSSWLETNKCPSAWLSLVDILDGGMPASSGASLMCKPIN